MMEKNSNLNFARAAIGEGNFKEAKAYYEAVLKENPKNLEAEWFYLFGSITDEIETEEIKINKKTADNYARLANNYVRLAKSFYPTLKYIATLGEDEKQTLAYAMIKDFPPLKNILKSKMIYVHTVDHSLVSWDDIMKVSMVDEIDKKDIAEDIINLFGDDKPYCLWSADIWKEMIAERFKMSKYRSHHDKGKELWFDSLAKRIKKYDPAYQMPQFKQAGCIAYSFGGANLVRPGE